MDMETLTRMITGLVAIVYLIGGFLALAVGGPRDVKGYILLATSAILFWVSARV